MIRTVPMSAHRVALLAATLFVAACAPRMIAERVEIQDPGAVRTTQDIRVEVDNCMGDAVTIRINPFVAYVHPDSVIRWQSPEGADSMAIVSKGKGQRNWPFAWGAGFNSRSRRATAGGAPLEAGRPARGRPNHRYQYHIHVFCGDGERIIDIDPDIIIFN